jgi:YfiH family protein
MGQGNDGFRWRQAACGTVLVCEPLLPVAPHLFTTREGDAGGGGATARDALYEAIASCLGDPRARVRQARQVHGAHAIVVEEQAEGKDLEGDILVTGRADQIVLVRVADCVPILIGDPRTGAVAAVHAGWRGTRAGAATVAVSVLAARFGARPADLVCAIGPSIGPCCYQVGPEVREAFVPEDGETAASSFEPDGRAAGSAAEAPGGRRVDGVRAAAWFTPDGQRWRLDLWKANQDQLTCAGVSPRHVHLARHCTACMRDRYYSYRIEGARAGRMVAAIQGRGSRGQAPGP